MYESPALKRLRELTKKSSGDYGPTGGIPVTPRQDLTAEKEKLVELKSPKSERQEIVYNAQQQECIDTIVAGIPCILTGPAGSGKTTTVKGAVNAALAADRIGVIKEAGHKWLRSGMHSIACVSFTNKAVNNLKKALPKELHPNCMTIHKLLEYQPEYITDYDPETGREKTTLTFLPARNSLNPLPYVDILIIDEATMTDVTLWNTLVEAIPFNTQVILIGDIQQLPPVFGKSIFIWAMQLGAKTIELTEIYRQALQSPIISLAHRVKEGKMLPAKDFDQYSIDAGEHGKVQIRPWKKKLGETAAIKTIQMFLQGLIDEGAYDPMEDVILTPFNKSFGTIIMNNAVATHLASKETEPHKREVWEIFAGINKKYFRVGEKVLYNKSEAYITAIEKNKSYYGKMPRKPSDTMSYDGIESDPVKRMEAANRASFGGMNSLEDIDAMLESMGDHTHGQERISRNASHTVTVYSPDLDTHFTLEGSGEINQLDLGYALTVHKSQGSEYNRVFFITHASQANMFFRELLYTGITRAAKELYIICEPNFFVKGIVSQRVAGNTLEEKIANFDRNVKLTKQGSNEMPKRRELLVRRTS